MMRCIFIQLQHRVICPEKLLHVQSPGTFFSFPTCTTTFVKKSLGFEANPSPAKAYLAPTSTQHSPSPQTYQEFNQPIRCQKSSSNFIT